MNLYCLLIYFLSPIQDLLELRPVFINCNHDIGTGTRGNAAHSGLFP